MLYLTPSPTLHPSICHISSLAAFVLFYLFALVRFARGFFFEFPAPSVISPAHLHFSRSVLLVSAPAEAFIMHPRSSGWRWFCSQSSLAPVAIGTRLCGFLLNALPFKQAGTRFPLLITPAGTSVSKCFLKPLFFFVVVIDKLSFSRPRRPGRTANSCPCHRLAPPVFNHQRSS